MPWKTFIVIKVAVGILCNESQEVLISKRRRGQHLGGFWEFPGGKIEMGESPYQALLREINEEVGITVKEAKPLIKINHQYSDKKVQLNVWISHSFTGSAKGLEGQVIKWVSLSQLQNHSFPAANQAIFPHIMSHTKIRSTTC